MINLKPLLPTLLFFCITVPGPAAILITGKELGIQFINGTTESNPSESLIHTQGTTNFSLVFDAKAEVTLGISSITIDFKTVGNPITFSSESFSGLRFFDVSELDFGDNDASVALPSLLGSSLNLESGQTNIQEVGLNAGDPFSASRVTVDENNIYVNFSGLTITQATGTRVVINLGRAVPEPSSALLLGFGALALAARRRR